MNAHRLVEVPAGRPIAVGADTWVEPPILTYRVRGEHKPVTHGVPWPGVHHAVDVSVWLDTEGEPRAYVDGPMLRLDGVASKHRRHLPVDLSAPLDDWLADVIEDALRRLVRL